MKKYHKVPFEYIYGDQGSGATGDIGKGSPGGRGGSSGERFDTLPFPMWENECTPVKEVFFSGKPIVFTDLTNGGSGFFCLSEYEDQAETFELLLYGDGSHHDLAEKAKQLYEEIELFNK